MAGIIIEVIYYIYIIYGWLLLANVLMSWVPSISESAVGRWIHKITEPYLSIFRKFIPPIGMIDISPIVGIFVYHFLGTYALMGFQNLLYMVF